MIPGIKIDATGRPTIQIKTDDGATITLEMACQLCNGSGGLAGGYYCKSSPSPGDKPCLNCGGNGFIMTEAGRQLLNFVHQRWGK